MASHGGMIGILAFPLYYSYKHKLQWTNLGDALVVAAPIGLFFGRCANFINAELYGRPANVSWAVQFPKELLESSLERERAVAAAQKIEPGVTDPDTITQAARHNSQVNDLLQGVLTPRPPSQLYEAFFEGVVPL